MRRCGTGALLAAAVLPQRELFARLPLDPREAWVARWRLRMPQRRFFRLRRRSPGARAAARTGQPVPDGAASTSAAAGGRRRRDKTPSWVWPSCRPLRRGASALEGGGRYCAAAARALYSAAAGPDGASGGSSVGNHAGASMCGGCGGAALVPTPQLAQAGLCSQARLRRCCCVERRHGATLAGTWLGRGAASAWRRGLGSAVVGKTVTATSCAAFGRQRLGGVSSLLGCS
jgi:hypothetical protein